MPLYYFHIYRHGALIRDEEGTVCAHLDAAKDEAKASAADLAHQVVAQGEPIDELCVEIHDDQERVLAGLTIQEVLSHPKHPAFEPSCGGPSRGGAALTVRIRKRASHRQACVTGQTLPLTPAQLLVASGPGAWKRFVSREQQ